MIEKFLYLLSFVISRLGVRIPPAAIVYI